MMVMMNRAQSRFSKVEKNYEFKKKREERGGDKFVLYAKISLIVRPFEAM